MTMGRRGYPDGIVRYPVSVSSSSGDDDSVKKISSMVVELDADLTVLDISVNDGCQVAVIYKNKVEKDVTVTVPHSLFETPDGNDISFVVAPGGYGELNLWRIENVVYARGC